MSIQRASTYRIHQKKSLDLVCHQCLHGYNVEDWEDIFEGEKEFESCETSFCPNRYNIIASEYYNDCLISIEYSDEMNTAEIQATLGQLTWSNNLLLCHHSHPASCNLCH